MATPLISVIMSVYNGEKYIGEAIDSVINQTFADWELIIINDCSSDKTANILAEYSLKDERIKVFTNEVNLRLPMSLNKAISKCSGKYIARMDSDDICLPKRLELQYKFMEENKDIMLSSCRFLTLKNGVYSSGGCGPRCDFNALKAMLLVSNPILHPGVIIRKAAMDKLNYNPQCTCTEDLNLWTEFAMENFKMQILPEYLLIYRLHDKQITSTTLDKQKSEVLKIENTYFDKYLEPMGDDLKEFYINGIYFNFETDVNKFLKFFKWARSINKRKKFFENDVLDYAFFEVLAEYKRRGVSKTNIIKAMVHFNIAFLVKEVIRRKKSAAAECKKCIEAATEFGLKQTSKSNEFPIFLKITNWSETNADI